MSLFISGWSSDIEIQKSIIYNVVYSSKSINSLVYLIELDISNYSAFYWDSSSTINLYL